MKPESIEQVNGDDKLNEMSITELLANGKRDFLVGNLPNALKALQRAVALSSAKYGTFAIECGEAYYLFGCALLDRARTENEVLGEAVKDVPLSEKTNDAEADADGDGKGSGVVSDSEIDGTEQAVKPDREKLAEMVIDALCAADTDAEKQCDEKSDEAVKPKEEHSSSEEPMATEEKQTTEVKDDAAQGDTTSADAHEGKINDQENPKDSTTKPKTEDAESAASGNQEEDGDDADEDEESADSGESTGDAEPDGEGDERTTLGVAWEWLDLARIVFDKRLRALTGTEPSTSHDGDTGVDATKTNGASGSKSESAGEPEASASTTASAEPEVSASALVADVECVAKFDPYRCATRVADSHVRLGEVLMERAEFESAIAEFESALRIRERQRDESASSKEKQTDEDRLDADLRALAETQFQLALAHQNAESYDNAVRLYEQAIETLSTRRSQLTTRLEVSDKDSDSAKRMTTDIEDLEGCINDLRQRIADAVDEKRFKALTQTESASGATPFGVSTSAASVAATPIDATHLMKRKRKSEADGENDEKENGTAAASIPLQKDAVDTETSPVPAKVCKVEEEGATNA